MSACITNQCPEESTTQKACVHMCADRSVHVFKSTKDNGLGFWYGVMPNLLSFLFLLVSSQQDARASMGSFLKMAY